MIAKKITEMELESGAEQPEVSFTRNPKVKDYLNSYNKEDLVESAKELDSSDCVYKDSFLLHNDYMPDIRKRKEAEIH